jgi:cytochrome c oxidase subunit II
MLGIFPASIGLNITFLAIVFVMGALISAVAFIALVYSTRHPEEKDSHALAKYEKHWVVLIGIIFVAFSVSTLSYLPYPYAHPYIKPTMTVYVQAQQFAWCLSPVPTNGSTTTCKANYVIPLGATVLFNVSSIDVTHGFGVYDAQGAILFQVQVMPGFFNSIMYQFTTAGTYYIRCLEFCGYGHYTMVSDFTVANS